jgi:hypothetical protein
VQYEQHHYSVPHQYVGEKLELHAGDSLMQVYFRQQLVASHPRRHRPGMTTEPGHMPKRHSKHQQWTPGRLKQWAQSIGPDTLTWISYQLDVKDHPEQAYRLCLGLLSLSREQIKSILKSNRDQLPEQLKLASELAQDHENIRGPHSFQ